MKRIGLAASTPFLAQAAAAHEVGPSAPAAAAVGWSFEAWVVACLLIAAALYAVGVARVWRRAGVGRGVQPGRIAAFASGWLLLVVALVSPLDALGGQLFAAHMIQHEVLMIAAAPLCVLGRPLGAWAWAVPRRWRRALGGGFRRAGWRVPWRAATGALGAWLLHAVALWVWHVPALFDAALESQSVHALQHASFLGTALLFWWSVLGATTRRDQGIALLALFTTMVHTGALGALLTVAPTPWYDAYLATAPQWGWSALEDQQLGGLVMWVPASLAYVGCALLLARRWLGLPGRAPLLAPVAADR